MRTVGVRITTFYCVDLAFLAEFCQFTCSTCWISSVSSVQLLSRVQLFATPWTAARQASLSITNSQSLLKLMSVESVVPSNHVILRCPLLLLHSVFPKGKLYNIPERHRKWEKLRSVARCLQHWPQSIFPSLSEYPLQGDFATPPSTKWRLFFHLLTLDSFICLLWLTG